MLEDIKKFYNRTIVEEGFEEVEETPITFVKIFHKQYPRLPSKKLEEDPLEGELEKSLVERKSTREFSDAPISFSEISRILGSCRILYHEGDFQRRTYPSAGARFPVEIYPICFNVQGLNPGAYHYDIQDRKVELLWQKDLRKDLDRIVTSVISNPALAIVMTSVISRAEVKYGIKAYPYSLLEAGHIAQNMQLSSAALGVGACSIGGFENRFISETLDLTGEEIPIYVIAFGKEDVQTNQF